MDFFSIISFMVLYYVRPQEWIGVVAALRPVTVVMAMAIVAMLMRYRGFRFTDFFKTSHDWLMLAYFVWIVVVSPAHLHTLGQIYSLFMFYIVTVQALSKMERIESFLHWWMALIFAVAALAVASEYGFDPMGSYDLTHGIMKERLVLNTSIFNNPNALGHTIYPVVLMLYFALFWKRPVFVRVFSLPIIALPLYCIYLTASKGTFLAGFGLGVFALTFGRPKRLQILILALALTAGVAGIKALPRMNELEKAHRDQAIQGRLAAFQFGLQSLKNNPRGIGYERFWYGFVAANHYGKASHSIYVQIGTELGYPGLFLYLAILYCCLRTLLAAKSGDLREERVRRILFVLLISCLISGWMVNFTYRATFFLMVGAIAALHRQLFEKDKPGEQTASATELVIEPIPVGALAAPASPALAMSALGRPAVAALPSPASDTVLDVQAEVEPVALPWNRFRWFDWAIVLVLVYATMRFWVFIMRYM